MPADLVRFLEQPEDVTDDRGDAQSIPTATSIPMQPEMTVPKREGDQQCPATASRGRPKTNTTPSTGPTTTGGIKTKCSTMLDPVKCPKDWVRAYTARMKEPPHWWPEFLSLCGGCTSELPETYVLVLAMRQAVGFRLPTAQAKKLGWWDPLPSLYPLCHNAFLPPGDLKGSQDIQETRKEKTLSLAKVL